MRFWKNEAQNQVGIFWQNSIFGGETLFQRPLEKSLLTWRTCSRYLKGPLNLALCVSKKNRDHTTHQSDFMSRKLKKVEILKKWSSKSGWNILTKPHFLGWNFFQRPLENFLLAWRTCSRYLNGPPNLALCVSKKIVTIRHTNKKIFAKNRKKTRFYGTSFGTIVAVLTKTGTISPFD